jgi:hypothetical protein
MKIEGLHLTLARRKWTQITIFPLAACYQQFRPCSNPRFIVNPLSLSHGLRVE